MRVIFQLQLALLKYEMNNFRNDGWVQNGYRKKYKKALIEYIKTLPILLDIERE